jgi:putative ABC transport system substrate-binding protein
LVASLSKPGGNITGFTSFEYSIGGKWIELLKEIAPRVRRVALLHDPTDPAATGFVRASEALAPALEVQLQPVAVRAVTEIESSIDVFASGGGGGLIVQPTAVVTANRRRVVAAAARHRLPAVYPYRYWIADGGLASYGFDNLEQYRGAASYVDRILKGTKPGDLPVQAPTKFELLINLRTAKALGLSIPESFVVRADEVIV